MAAWYCSTCYGDGIVIASPKEGENAGLVYAFRCVCSVGQAKPQTGIPQYTSRVASRYPVLEVIKPEPKTPAARPSEPLEPADSLW